MAAYSVTWSSDIVFDVINELSHPENIISDIYLDYSS